MFSVKKILSFQVPALPFLPFVSVFVDIILMMRLQPMTWVRLGVWILVGKYRDCKACTLFISLKIIIWQPTYNALTE